MAPPSTRVIFFQVKDPATKMQVITEAIRSHFEKKEACLILVEDEKTQTFVDDLLWKIPDTSFVPHISSDTPTRECIAITKTKHNVNQAKIAINLCPTPLMLDTPFRIIYELEDLSHPNKNRLASIRFDAYKAAGFLIESKPASPHQ